MVYGLKQVENLANTFKIDGLEGVIREIQSISDDKVKRSEILKVLRRQSKPILGAIKSNTPIAEEVVSFRGVEYNPGNLKKSMAIKTSPSKNYPNVLIGPRKGRNGRKALKNDGFYAFWIQYGTKFQKPNDFIWKASAPLMDGTNTKMSAELEKYLEKKIKETNL